MLKLSLNRCLTGAKLLFMILKLSKSVSAHGRICLGNRYIYIYIYIPDSIPALQRSLHIPWTTKNNVLIMYYIPPTVDTGTHRMSKSISTASNKMTPGPDINPFSVLADEMDNMPPTHPYVTLLKNYKKRKTTNRYRTN